MCRTMHIVHEEAGFGVCVCALCFSFQIQIRINETTIFCFIVFNCFFSRINLSCRPKWNIMENDAANTHRSCISFNLPFSGGNEQKAYRNMWSADEWNSNIDTRWHCVWCFHFGTMSWITVCTKHNYHLSWWKKREMRCCRRGHWKVSISYLIRYLFAHLIKSISS